MSFVHLNAPDNIYNVHVALYMCYTFYIPYSPTYKHMPYKCIFMSFHIFIYISLIIPISYKHINICI